MKQYVLPTNAGAVKISNRVVSLAGDTDTDSANPLAVKRDPDPLKDPNVNV